MTRRTRMKKKLVLHICCAPDQAWVTKVLKEDYDLVGFFCNPNIHPEMEYSKRLEESKMVAKRYGTPFFADAYEPKIWQRAIKGLEETPEGGKRCEECFLFRLRRTARFCKENGYTRYTTTMSISPHKRIETLNKKGNEAADKFGVTYCEFNFKKKNGFLNSIRLSKELNLYRQDYCGCIYSLQERDERKLKKKEFTSENAEEK